MKKQLATTAVLTALVLGMTFSGAAQTLEQDNQIQDSDKDNTTNQLSNIDVTVTSTTSIDVRPTSLSFPNMDVGTQQDTADGPQDDNEFGSISLENIGSEYIDRVWVGATSTTDDPFGTGLPGEYNAGNFLQVKPANSTSKASVRGNTSTYHYVNRHDFANSWTDNVSDIPSYIEASPSQTLTSGAADTYVGRLRAGDEWYFYSIVTGSSNDVCDGSGDAVLRVGNTSHTTSQFGTVDFTLAENGGPRDWTEYEISSTSGSYGITESTVQIDLNDEDATDKYREYDILTSCDPEDAGLSKTDPHTIRTRYNVQAGDVEDITAVAAGDSTGDTAGTRTQFLLDAASAGDMLFPGESITVDTAVEVPQGVPTGGVSTGDLTFYVTSDYDADISN